MSYEHLGHAWAALTSGRLDEARRRAEWAVAATPFFHPLASPLAARAALWAGDRSAAGTVLDGLLAAGYRGAALANDESTIRAGIAALEGRAADSFAGYREALRAWRTLGLAFDEALAALDMATLLDARQPEVRSAAEAGRATFVRLGAAPLVARLDAALGTVPAAEVVPASPRGADPVPDPTSA